MSSDDPAVRARRRAEAKLGFYKHLGVYLAIGLMLFAIDFVAFPDTSWAGWPVFGWGIAVAIHAISVFAFRGEEKILDRMTEEEMRRDGANDQWGREWARAAHFFSSL
ncbi:2TM domain-containing protein [Oricola sp.]|uniref:2TM domain-containing protein n=1 Tax=Oricola sp. TaxID=1979950 RepID=UPI003BAA2BC5